MKSNPIVIVLGQTNSIIYEIFFKALKSKKYRSPILVVTCKNIFLKKMKKFNFNEKIKIHDFLNLNKNLLLKKKINLVNIPYHVNFKSKKKIYYEREYIKRTFDAAIKIIKSGITNKFINGPINKSLFLNKEYLGITEYLSDKFKEKNIGMLIYNKKLAVSPLTTHLPIKLVSKNISKKLILDRIKLINNFYLQNFKKKPLIAVTGLNPHCESILKKNEDKIIISKAVANSKKSKFLVYGPYSADTIFLKQNRKKFDVILGMYHDQVLTPLKTLYEYDAINLTMGLPFLRVSPDHGPNEKMINKNNSNPISLIRALEFLDKA